MVVTQVKDGTPIIYPDTTEETVSDVSTTESVLLAQIIKPSSDFVLSSASLYLKKVGTPASDITIEIKELNDQTTQVLDYFNDTLLGSATLAKSGVTTSAAWVAAGTFDAGITFQQDKYYAIYATTGVNTLTNGYFVYFIENSIISRDAVLRAYSWIDSESTFVDVNTSFSSVVGTSALHYKLNGGTWDNQIVVYSELLALAGEGASATATGINLASTYASNAEGYVNAITRYDWGANWANLDEKAKKLVKAVMTSLAAAEIVEYSYSGYSSRFEAREKAFALRNFANQGLNALLNDVVKKYIQDGA